MCLTALLRAPSAHATDTSEPAERASPGRLRQEFSALLRLPFDNLHVRAQVLRGGSREDLLV